MNRTTKCRKEKTGRILRQVMAALLISGVSYGHAWAAAEEGTVEERPADAYTMDDVIVTAERVPTSRMDTPANVSVITAEEIEANHYGSVAEALEHVNGVFVSGGGSSNNEEVRINGDERVVIMVDGRRINNDQGSMTRASANLESIASMKNIERIEVVKGGGSALYGSDVVGGVINIITKKGDSLRTTLDVNAGSWGTYN
jgi:vitamin B12 transporter